MLAGSTSGLKSFLARLPSKLVRNSTVLARGHSTAPAHQLRPDTTPRHPQTVAEERSGPEARDPSMTNAYPASGAPFHSPCPSVVTDGPSSVFSGPPTPTADRSNVDPTVGVGLLSVTQCHARVPAVGRCHKTLHHTTRKCPAQKTRTLLWVMLTTKSPDRAWAAYQKLLSHGVVIPNHSLHQLVRLLASVKPRTRTVYLQLLSVLKTLQKNHGRLRLWEWNILLDCVGKQWHKTRLEDYENALDIFNKKGVLPMGNTASLDESLRSTADTYQTQQEPDTWTYNTLLSIASRTNMPLAVRHASSLLLASGLPPDRYTHLCLLRFFAIRNDLRNIRSTLRKMKEQGLEVGLDGINACLWACVRNGRFDVALPIYCILRNNIKPTPHLGDHRMDENSRYIRDTVGLDNLQSFEPDETTYTMMIQALAYHGDLRNALSVFIDMLSTARKDSSADHPVCFQPSMAAFRALFLGFARHGRGREQRPMEADTSVLFPSSQAAWDQDTLETIFVAFLRLPSLPKPTDRLVYWILVAFKRTSGNDAARLREVWTKLEAKYGGGWGGRLEEIRRAIFVIDEDM